MYRFRSTWFVGSLVVCVVSLLIVSAARSVSPAESKSRVFEIRTYTCEPGKLPDLLKRFREHTTKLFEKHDMTNVGYWVPTDEPRSGDTLIYVVAHPSREAATRNWDAFRSDPDWIKAKKASEANGKIVTKVESVFAEATDFSPLK